MFRSQFSIWLIAGGTCKLLCVMSLLCMLASCQWRDARAVIATADSLDVTEHVIYSDTAALGGVIRKLDNPVGRIFQRNTLGKAYYYMGRNLEDYCQQVAEAAECYIEADRLQIDDPIYKGRINSCMGYICAQNNSDSLALVFYDRASEDFAESGDEWRYAQSLLNISKIQTNLYKFTESDSILHIAHTYNYLDSEYRARYLETKGLYFYKQQQYDSALVYFQYGLDYRKRTEQTGFCYLKLMQIYYNKRDMLQAIKYAQYIIELSNNPNYLVNAYYCLMQDAKEKNNTPLLSKYSHARADAQKLLTQNVQKSAAAMPLLENYVQNPHPLRWIWIMITIVVLLSVLISIIATLYRKRAETRLRVAHEQIDELSIHMEEQKEELYKHDIANYYKKHFSKIRAKHPTPPNKWNDYNQMKQDLLPILGNWIVALDHLNLTNREKVFCVLCFIYPHLSISEVANCMHNTKESVRVLKTRIIQKLGVTSVKFYDFLQKLLPVDKY